jgi:hypothetical protein
METLVIFLAIIAIQMFAAHFAKQKKEAAKKAAQKSSPPPQATKPIPDPFREIRRAMGLPSSEEPEFEPEPEPICLEQDLPNKTRLEIKKQKPIIKEEKNNSQFSILNSQLNLKNPAQGILWVAILHEPRYRVKWKRR